MSANPIAGVGGGKLMLRVIWGGRAVHPIGAVCKDDVITNGSIVNETITF